MCKQYVSYFLIEKYKNIKSMIKYHNSSIDELLNSQIGRDNFIPSNMFAKFCDSSINYHECQIKKFDNELQKLLSRSDFNEEYVISFLERQSNYPNVILENQDNVYLYGEVDICSKHTCCVVM